MNKEYLDQYIYDYGLEATMKNLNLTDTQIEGILFKKPLRINKSRTTIEILTDTKLEEEKLDIIFNSIAENYEMFKKYYCKKGDLDVINIRSETLEDKFHNAIVKITENLSQFEYRDDEQTVAYIKSRLYFQDKAHKSKERRDKDRLPVKLEFESLSNYIKQY